MDAMTNSVQIRLARRCPVCWRVTIEGGGLCNDGSIFADVAARRRSIVNAAEMG
jgi:hypothetical protein